MTNFPVSFNNQIERAKTLVRTFHLDHATSIFKTGHNNVGMVERSWKEHFESLFYQYPEIKQLVKTATDDKFADALKQTFSELCSQRDHQVEKPKPVSNPDLTAEVIVRTQEQMIDLGLLIKKRRDHEDKLCEAQTKLARRITVNAYALEDIQTEYTRLSRKLAEHELKKDKARKNFKKKKTTKIEAIKVIDQLSAADKKALITFLKQDY